MNNDDSKVTMNEKEINSMFGFGNTVDESVIDGNRVFTSLTKENEQNAEDHDNLNENGEFADEKGEKKDILVSNNEGNRIDSVSISNTIEHDQDYEKSDESNKNEIPNKEKVIEDNVDHSQLNQNETQNAGNGDDFADDIPENLPTGNVKDDFETKENQNLNPETKNDDFANGREILAPSLSNNITTNEIETKPDLDHDNKIGGEIENQNFIRSDNKNDETANEEMLQSNNNDALSLFSQMDQINEPQIDAIRVNSNPKHNRPQYSPEQLASMNDGGSFDQNDDFNDFEEEEAQAEGKGQIDIDSEEQKPEINQKEEGIRDETFISDPPRDLKIKEIKPDETNNGELELASTEKNDQSKDLPTQDIEPKKTNNEEKNIGSTENTDQIPDQHPEDGMEINDEDIEATAASTQTPQIEKAFTPRQGSGFRIPTLHSIDESFSLSQLPPLSTTPRQDADCKKLLSEYTTTNKLPPLHMRKSLIQYINREKVNSIVAQKFTEASKLQDVASRLILDIVLSDEKKKVQGKIETLENKLIEVEKSIKDLGIQTESLIRDELAKQKESRSILLANHEDQLESFESRWNDSSFLQKFARPSTYLLQMKGMERSMVLSKMFEEAENHKKKTQMIEREESRTAQQKAYTEMTRERTRLLEKQRIEISSFDSHCNKSLGDIKKVQELRLQPLVARKNTLLSDLKVLNNQIESQTVTKSVDIPHPIMTPRTAQRLSLYKSVSKAPQVTVKPLGNVNPMKKKSRCTTAIGTI